MTFENFEEIFWLIKDDITKENTKMRDPIHSDYNCSHDCFFFYQQGNHDRAMFMSFIYVLLNNEKFNIYYFRPLWFFTSNKYFL